MRNFCAGTCAADSDAQRHPGAHVGIACGGSSLRQIQRPLPQVGTCAADSDAQRHFRHPCRNRLRRFQPTANSATASVGRNLHSKFRRTAASPAPVPESPAAVPTYGKSTTAPAGRNLRSRCRRTATFPAPVSESPAAVPTTANSATASVGRNLRSRFRHTAAFPAPASESPAAVPACGKFNDRSRRSEPAQQIPTHSGIPGHLRRNRLRRFQPTAIQRPLPQAGAGLRHRSGHPGRRAVRSGS